MSKRGQNGLTVKAVEALAPRDKRYEVKDPAVEGLWVVVYPSGEKSFVYRFRFDGAFKKLTIGRVSLAEARTRAREARVMRDAGQNPAVAKAADKVVKLEEARKVEADLRTAAADLVETVAAKFIEKHHKPASRSWKEAERLINKEIVTPWRGRRLSQIGKADIHDLLDAIIERPAPIVANRIFSHLRAMCRWAQGRGIIDRSPCEGLGKPSPETSRTRVLNDKELGLVWRASESVGYPFGDMMKLLILTGQRRGEVSGLLWTEINRDERLWKLPPERTKNKKAHDVPISDAMLAILDQLPRIEGSDFALTTTGVTPISGFSRSKRRLDEVIAALNGGEELAPWTPHDIRRSVASGMARLGVDLVVIERLLNHYSDSFAGIVGVYQHHKFEAEMRDALERWSAHLESLSA